ncbi:short-chain dehydrogenase [Platysternon megacephalum]|uniref:Short-chain dehydrogenase n=1 Tax=Platysternon megacephalum TaxID=55544 RepID=A0A4D9DJI3_9SAUR|nr:short-chain dehydrogenase [Platysternon megacephalum]
MERDTEADQMAYAQALVDWAEVHGYDEETRWDVVTMAALGMPYDKAQWRSVNTLSGGEQKRLVLEYVLRGPAEVLILDEPDNFLDVPGKEWLEAQLKASDKTILLISHDRELLSRAPDLMVTLEPTPTGSRAWMHHGNFSAYADARAARNASLEEQRRRWEEELAKLKALVQMYKQKAAYNSDMASRYSAAQTRLARFESEGPPEALPIPQSLKLRLEGGRTAKRAVIVESCELTGLMKPFSTEVWFGERLAVLGSNGSGKSHFLRLLARGGTDPDVEHQPVGDAVPDPVSHTGVVRLGSRVRPGWFAQTHQHASLLDKTLLEILHRGDEHRSGMGREQAARALDRYGLARAGEQRFSQLSGGQQARMQILLLELSGATLLLLDEPTDNLDLASVEALEDALRHFTGTVVAVTHDRWFASGFDRFLVFCADGRVRETPEPVWDEGRVVRTR